MATSEIETAPVGETADPARFIVASRHDVLTKLVDALMQGASFVALTGLPGVGKTTMAAAVRELLAARSVAALHIGRGESGAIRLRTLAAQLLGKPEDAINGHDAERLFDIMTAHGSSGRRLVIIVDDAELVHTEVFTYLRLLMSVGIEPVPQFLFVGDPSFWHRAAEAAHANVRDLITDWVDIEPLTSAESREFAELLLGSAGPAAGAALNEASLDELVRASHGLIGQLMSLLASAAVLPRGVPRAQVADPCLDDASAVATGESDNVLQSENHAGWLPKDAVPVQERLDPEVAAALFGSRSLGHGSAKPRRVPVFASLAGVLMLAGLVGAVAYRRILDPSDHGARAEPAMFVEASNDGVHSAPPDTTAGAQSEPSFEIMHSAQAATSGDLGAEMTPTASTATSEAVTPPAQRDPTFPAASLTASSPGVGVPGEADDAAVTKAAIGVEEPQAGSAPLATSSIPASRAATEAPAVPPAGPSASAAMTVDATTVPAVAQPESPTAATVAPSQAGAEHTDTPTVPGIAQPAAASSSAETEAPPFAAQPPAVTPAALTDAVNAGANAAGPPAGTQSAAPSSAGDNAVPLPVVSSPVAPTGATGTADTEAHTGPATVQPITPSSAAQSEPLPSDAPPPAAASEAVKSDAIGSDTGSTAAAMQPSAPVTAPTAAVPPVGSTPAVAPEVPASGAAAAEAPAIPAAIVQPAAVPPATRSQAATNAAPTVATLSKAPSTTAASSRLVSPDLGSLLRRGDAMLDLGDISAARLLYERAAALGSAKAATTLGKTYDPAFLASIQVRGLAPNRAAAASWYRKGADLGDAEAADRLARLTKAQ